MSDCIFCKIVKGEMSSTMVYEDEDVIAIKDIAPKAPIHVLLIPKKHIENLSDAKQEEVELVGKINLLAPKIAKDLGQEQFKLTTNNGKLAGQVVMHMHYHLLSGWKDKEEVKSELHL